MRMAVTSAARPKPSGTRKKAGQIGTRTFCAMTKAPEAMFLSADSIATHASAP
jgi:hypothetical protein